MVYSAVSVHNHTARCRATVTRIPCESSLSNDTHGKQNLGKMYRDLVHGQDREEVEVAPVMAANFHRARSKPAQMKTHACG